MNGKDKKTTDNSAIILSRMAALNRSVTQVELTSMLPLKRTSVYYIFESLEKSGLVQRAAAPPVSGKGAPPIHWQINPDAGAFIAAHLSSSILCFAVYDFNCKLVSIKKVPAPETLEEALKIYSAKIKEVKTEFLGSIILIPGVIEPDSGELLYSRTWKIKNFPLKYELENSIHKNTSPSIIIENRIRAAAWGEKIEGSCRDTDNFLVFYLEGKMRNGKQVISGIGSSLVIDGQLFKGAHGAAGELEPVYYKWMTELRKKYGADYEFSFSTMDKDDIKTFASCLGENFAHIVNYLAPQKISLIFDSIEVPEDFIVFFRQAFLTHLFSVNSMSFPLEISPLAGNAVLCGAADLLRKNYFNPENQFFLKHIADSLASF